MCCRRTITERQSRLPSLPLLPSVQIFFAYFCPPSKTRPAQRNTIKRDFVEGPSRNASPLCPSLPLLPSVQILFASFCPPSKPSPPNVTQSNAILSKDHRETPAPLPFVNFASFCSNPLCLLLSAGGLGWPPICKRTSCADYAFVLISIRLGVRGSR